MRTMPAAEKRIENFKQTSRKRLSDLMEISDAQNGKEENGKESDAKPSTPKIVTPNTTGVNAGRTEPGQNLQPGPQSLNGVGTYSKERDPELAKLMEEKTSTMEKIKELVGMTKNVEEEEGTWNALDELEVLENDPNIKKGCIGEPGCAYHCIICDKHLSGFRPLIDHRKSQNHQRKIHKKARESQNAELLVGRFGSDVANQDGELGPCGLHGCTHHCRVCDTCMTGLTPARQHLDGDKHKRRERSLANGSVRNSQSPPLLPGEEQPSGSERRRNSSVCSKPGCISHCAICDLCFLYPNERSKHDASKHDGDQQNVVDCGTVSLDKSSTNGIVSGASGSVSGSLSTGIESLAWDGFAEPRSDRENNFITQGTCTTIGCCFHCVCCDTHLSGQEPMRQHSGSLKHLNMEQVYVKGQRRNSLSSGASTDSLTGISSHLEGLSISPMPQVTEVQEITGPCGKIGCTFHCTICSTCLSGTVPKNQHIVSRNHSQVRERLNRAGQPSPPLVGSVMKPPSSPGPGVDDLSVCHQPGCAYHCHVCDSHLTGREPMEQHMKSKNHEKRKKATVALQMQPPQPSDGLHQDGPEVSEAACSHPGCRYHCNICDLHFSGSDPMQQHVDSPKHSKKKQAFLKLRGQTGKPVSEPSSPNTQPIPLGSKQTDSQEPHEVPHPRPIGYERSLQQGHNPFSLGPQQPMTPKNDFRQYGGNFTMSTPTTSAPSGFNPNLSTPRIIQKRGDGNQDTQMTIFGTCPESSRICKFHCYACGKHFNENLPKQQHESSAKHAKAVQRYLTGLKTREIQQDDSFIVESSRNSDLQLKTQLKTSKSSSSVTGLPKWLAEDRQLAPIQKVPTGSYSPQTTTVPRDYQMELYNKAMKDDTVCFLPTGTGKTLVSALVIDHMLQMNPTRPVLFLVEKILLVLQQTKYLRTELGRKQYTRWNPKTKDSEVRTLNVAGLCSGHTDACGMSSLQELDVIVSTAGFFLNVLTKDWIKWQDFCLIVIDEVHHCTKNHVFNTLMQDYHLHLHREVRPKLLGMTASPAGEANVPLTQEKLQTLLENIGMAKLSIVEDHAKQLGDYQTRTQLEIDYATMSEEETALENDIQMYLLHIFNFLVKTTNLGSLRKELGLNIQEGQRAVFNAAELVGEGLEAFRSSLGMIEVKDKCKSMGRFIKKVITHADAVCSSLVGLRLCGEEAVYHSLKPLVDDASSCGFEEMSKVGFSCESLQSRADSYEKTAVERRDKMTAFCCLVKRITSAVQWDELDDLEVKKPIVMVIVRERKVAKLLATLLQSNSEVQDRRLNVEYIVGHGDGQVGMSVSQQRKMLEDTWQHKYQVLVATSVAEEGLDLPECKLVIEMDPPGNVTSLVQIRGRARKQCSLLVAVCRNEDQVAKIKQLEDKEHCMMEAARAVVGQQKLAASRMLPFPKSI